MKKFLLSAGLILACAVSQGQNWTSLFNGKDLTGWHQAVGKGEYTVQNKAITGTTHTTGGGNSFLVTDAKYSDFILEFQFRMEEGAGNSGLQFRSNISEKTGRVCGYQFEIDNSLKRRFTGGLYEEGDRGQWFYKLSMNNPARDAAKMGKWNKCRIEAVGNHIRTFVNGVECADLLVDWENEGFFGLQVHQVSDESTFGKCVQWRKIRICTENIEKYLTPANKNVPQVNYLANTLTERQKADGWKLLFDGKTMDGWQSINGPSAPTRWIVKDGILQVNNPDMERTRFGSDLITTEKYENFWLSVDFKIGQGVNSGIKYFINPGLYGGGNASVGCEFQVLDDVRHPDAKAGKNGNRTIASLYDIIPSDKSDMWFNLGQWNTAWVIVRGAHVEHWLNGTKVVEYDRDTDEFKAKVAESKFKGFEGFGTHKTGHILLQDHNDYAQYRNIMIKEL